MFSARLKFPDFSYKLSLCQWFFALKYLLCNIFIHTKQYVMNIHDSTVKFRARVLPIALHIGVFFLLLSVIGNHYPEIMLFIDAILFGGRFYL